jgi:hypothetical protein
MRLETPAEVRFRVESDNRWRADIMHALSVLRDQAWRGFETLVPVIMLVENADADTAVDRMKEIRANYFTNPDPSTPRQ